MYITYYINRTGYLNTNYEVAHLMERAKEFYELSNGMFDVSISPVSKLWKRSLVTKSLPEKREIRSALRHVGLDKIHIDGANDTDIFALSRKNSRA